MTPDLRGTQVVIVCEGKDDYDFARGYLGRMGAARFVQRVNPRGKGGGNDWVVKTFAKELKAYRSATTQTALVVLTDEDGKSIQARKQALESSQSMRELDQKPRSPEERVLIVVPTRHIESWFEFVVAGSCNEKEVTAYKHRYGHNKPKKPAKWGRELADRCKTTPKDAIADWPSALQDACRELSRL